MTQAWAPNPKIRLIQGIPLIFHAEKLGRLEGLKSSTWTVLGRQFVPLQALGTLLAYKPTQTVQKYQEPKP
ncbi:MAG TPA: hypothetical protein VGE08_05455 [Steroidobacter sp.]|uniref:hypothetical protein n=1 Tax=Steroidobacter sp. TaxID=1978227 RepID=UPI002EDAE0D2